MDIQAEKLNLIEWLAQLNNMAIVNEIKAIKDKETDWWDDLTKEQKEDIEAGLVDLDQNRKKSFTTVLSKYK
jgi:hypothetical protein